MDQTCQCEIPFCNCLTAKEREGYSWMLSHWWYHCWLFHQEATKFQKFCSSTIVQQEGIRSKADYNWFNELYHEAQAQCSNGQSSNSLQMNVWYCSTTSKYSKLCIVVVQTVVVLVLCCWSQQTPAVLVEECVDVVWMLTNYKQMSITNVIYG